MERCRRCRRRLTSEKAKRLGYGATCYKVAKNDGVNYTTVPDFIKEKTFIFVHAESDSIWKEQHSSEEEDCKVAADYNNDISVFTEEEYNNMDENSYIKKLEFENEN